MKASKWSSKRKSSEGPVIQLRPPKHVASPAATKACPFLGIAIWHAPTCQFPASTTSASQQSKYQQSIDHDSVQVKIGTAGQVVRITMSVIEIRPSRCSPGTAQPDCMRRKCSPLSSCCLLAAATGRAGVPNAGNRLSHRWTGAGHMLD